VKKTYQCGEGVEQEFHQPFSQVIKMHRDFLKKWLRAVKISLTPQQVWSLDDGGNNKNFIIFSNA
jgi:hypothetical protein